MDKNSLMEFDSPESITTVNPNDLMDASCALNSEVEIAIQLQKELNESRQAAGADEFRKLFSSGTVLGPKTVEQYFSKRLKEGGDFSDYSNQYLRLDQREGGGYENRFKGTKKVLFYDGDFAIVLAKNAGLDAERRQQLGEYLNSQVSFFGFKIGRFFGANRQMQEIEKWVGDNVPQAVISAEINIDEPKNPQIKIVQIQASRYKKSTDYPIKNWEFAERIFEDREIFNFRWEMALIEAMLDLGEKFGIKDITIQAAEHNKWTDSTELWGLQRRYDITAKRYRDSKGRRFFKDEITANWILRMN